MQYTVVHSKDPYLLARLATDLQMNLNRIFCEEDGLTDTPFLDGKEWLCEGDLIKASKEFHSCTEAEFMEAYADVEQRMSLNPILAR